MKGIMPHESHQPLHSSLLTIGLKSTLSSLGCTFTLLYLHLFIILIINEFKPERWIFGCSTYQSQGSVFDMWQEGILQKV